MLLGALNCGKIHIWEKVMADKRCFSKSCLRRRSPVQPSVCRDDGCLLFLVSERMGPLHKDKHVSSVQAHR